MRVRSVGGLAAFGAAFSMSGCLVGPDYLRPAAPVPAAYKEIKGWKIAQPRDGLDKGAWWSVYHDAKLDQLERQVVITNQTVKEYEAAYRQAKAIVGEARSQLFPSLTATPSLTRSNGSHTLFSLEGNASWEPDLWGKIRRTIESDVAGAQVSAADLANATLSAQASLATDYFELREADALQDLLNDTVEQYKRTLAITQNQYTAGTAARSDVITAQTQLLSTQAQAINEGVTRAEFEHAIAVLTGKPPAELAISHGKLARTIPDLPVGYPSTLLERRPDIAAAERTMQEENALIGVAIAGYYPNVTLSGLLGYETYPFSHISVSNPIWSLSASAAQTIFNGGLTDAQVAAARATYDQSVATYRQTVLSAFQQVEDALSSLRILGHQALVEEEAVRAAEQAVAIALNEYQAGTQTYTTVVTAQATALSDEETALSVRALRLVATVSLIEALGGGWSRADLPAATN
jgi:NodT family efflux transporter outer membrane factor (OMF) lipoprotein